MQCTVAKEMWEDLQLLPGWSVLGMAVTWGVFVSLQVSSYQGLMHCLDLCMPAACSLH